MNATTTRRIPMVATRRRAAAAAATVTALAVLSGGGGAVDAFQTTSSSRPALSAATTTREWGGHLGAHGPAHLSAAVSSRGSRLSTTWLAASTDTEETAKAELMAFEPTGPTVVLDDPPTDVYDKAITRTLQWMAATAFFGLGLWAVAGATTAEEFFAGYLVEQSLSVDNLFVFLILFDYFAVPIRAQDRVLNWGIYGAIVMRAVMIGLGAAALENFHAILLVFAAILVYSSGKVLFGGDEEEEDMNENAIVNFSKNLFDSVDEFDGDRFFTIAADGVKKATPLFICMIAVELSDVVFAVDSIPAVFGVTSNPLVVFTSNIFAIMGLRSLYTILSKAAADLEYLEPAVAIVLGFIGAKMIAEYFGYKIATEVALAVVATLLSGGIGLSVWGKEDEEEEASEEA